MRVNARPKPRQRSDLTSLKELFLTVGAAESLAVSGYTRLIDCPEVQTAIDKIADLVSEMTIQTYRNTDKGDERVRDELARKVDISPWSLGTRKTFVQWVVQTMLGLGDGNAFVLPVTQGDRLRDLVPLPYNAVSVTEDGAESYTVQYAGQSYKPDEILHFVLNPDPAKPWRGRGFRVQLKDVTRNLRQAAETKNGFMSSKWKPSVIVRVDALADEFAGKAGRSRFLREYIESEEAGQPWVIPSELLDVQQVKPLSLADLAINDSVETDKKSVAAMIGVPAYMVGAGTFNEAEHNAFIRTRVMPIATTVTQTLTKGLISESDKYFKMNPRSLYAYNLKDLADVADNQYVRGLMEGNEVRDWLGLSPKDGLDKLVMLENYIPADMIGQQKKLINDAGGSDA